MTISIQHYVAKSVEIRSCILKMVHKAKASHVGSALSIVDILAVIYFCGRYNLTSNLEIAHRDSLILSKGHACSALYATLNAGGHLSDNLIKTYGENDSPLMHHISHKVPFVDFSTGSLGHGLPICVGLAKSDQINNVSHERFCLIGDGELAEGSNWEALLFAAHHKLNNITLVIDHNNLQSLDTVENTLNLESISAKLMVTVIHKLILR